MSSNFTLFSLLELKVNLRLCSTIEVVAVCADETVPSTALSTLILEFRTSTLRTLTFSEPIPKISLSRMERSPLSMIPPPIEKYVIIPVVPVVPTPVVRLKNPVDTPILNEPLIELTDVLIPDIDTRLVLVKL